MKLSPNWVTQPTTHSQGIAMDLTKTYHPSVIKAVRFRHLSDAFLSTQHGEFGYIILKNSSNSAVAVVNNFQTV